LNVLKLFCVDGLGDYLVAQNDVVLHIDVYKIDQVIRNLLTNAV